MPPIILILGYGLSGQALARYCDRHGIHYRIYDDKAIDHVFFIDAEAVIAYSASISAAYISPGFKPHHPMVRILTEYNIPVYTDIEYFAQKWHGRMIAVTGTNGKSTVTSWLSQALCSQDEVWKACGNIGTPVIDMLSEDNTGVVLELSSAQIHYMHNILLDVALFLPIAPDHWDWHGSHDAYVEAKLKMSAWGPSIIHHSLEHLIAQPVLTYGRMGDVYWQDDRIIYPDGRVSLFDKEHYWRLVDRDNLTAVAAALYFMDRVYTQMPCFPVLPYRCDRYMHDSGWVFVNNSKATNLHATEHMLTDIQNVYGNMPCIILLGGVYKESFVMPSKRPEDKVYLFGQLALDVGEIEGVVTYPTLDAVLLRIEEDMKSLGMHVVVFAPGGASFDAFKDYKERGAYFAQWVMSL